MLFAAGDVDRALVSAVLDNVDAVLLQFRHGHHDADVMLLAGILGPLGAGRVVVGDLIVALVALKRTAAVASVDRSRSRQAIAAREAAGAAIERRQKRLVLDVLRENITLVQIVLERRGVDLGEQISGIGHRCRPSCYRRVC